MKRRQNDILHFDFSIKGFPLWTSLRIFQRLTRQAVQKNILEMIFWRAKAARTGSGTGMQYTISSIVSTQQSMFLW